MPTIYEMRQFCLNAYPNASVGWRKHIATTKNTRQIVAIYKKLKNKSPKPVSDEYHQIDIWEYCFEKSKCDTCKHKNDPWDTEPCDSCCGAHCGYEKED